ncbi:MAG TPA: hypothetical protein VD962_08840, partial [Rubricoccaceae bacterium]|nr:hypothetical protein [Rubricoccaceae bacterium]
MRRLLLLLTVLAAHPALAQPGAVRYVDVDAPSGGDGASWGTAFNQLPDALAYAASHPEVRQL